jgi:LytS/YehU family sensor histidine kinase
MIYDANTDKIGLEKDIHYLSSYIDLKRLRLADKVTIIYVVKGVTSGISIAPMLLITFIENAFKHGISYIRPSTISINIEVVDKMLTMQVSNPVFQRDNFEEGGMGLKNAKRRLELLYPGKYWLDVISNKEEYSVNLKIDLRSD